VPSRYDRTLRYGRGVNTDRMIDDFGFVPEFTTREAAEKYADYIRLRRYHERDNETMFDRELLEYVQRKMQQMPAINTEMFARFTPAGARRSDAALDDDDDGSDV
jgi:hypothetical protein